jgi:hypothetical protein
MTLAPVPSWQCSIGFHSLYSASCCEKLWDTRRAGARRRYRRPRPCGTACGRCPWRPAARVLACSRSQHGLQSLNHVLQSLNVNVNVSFVNHAETWKLVSLCWSQDMVRHGLQSHAEAWKQPCLVTGIVTQVSKFQHGFRHKTGVLETTLKPHAGFPQSFIISERVLFHREGSRDLKS